MITTEYGVVMSCATCHSPVRRNVLIEPTHVYTSGGQLHNAHRIPTVTSSSTDPGGSNTRLIHSHLQGSLTLNNPPPPLNSPCLFSDLTRCGPTRALAHTSACWSPWSNSRLVSRDQPPESPCGYIDTALYPYPLSSTSKVMGHIPHTAPCLQEEKGGDCVPFEPLRHLPLANLPPNVAKLDS